MREEKNICDVIVVGAGFAGLTTAYELISQGKTVKVLEARERVGGRVYTKQIDADTYVDLGGQWIGPTQDRVYKLANKLGVKTFTSYNSGTHSLIIKGQVRRYKGLIPRIDPFSLLNLDYTIKKLNRLSKSISLEKPWESPNAQAFDSQTLATFLDKNIYFSSARKILDIGLETVFACNASEISLLHALFYIKSGVDIEHLFNMEGGAQQDRFIGGAQTLANRLAEKLGDIVMLSSPVKRIEQSENKVLVMGDNFQYQTKKVVIALPPALANRIAYFPLLPREREQLTQRVPMGFVVKCYAIYEKPFWRDSQFSGLGVSESGYLQATFDASPYDAKQGILLGFSIADRGRAFMKLSSEKRKESVLKSFSDYFGSKALSPIHYLDHCWADEEWSRGCYVGFMPPGVWTNYGESLTKPVGNIHWAGTETSPVWNGYIDGAIYSGERVAKEISEKF
jgi:monoamine oxidase